MGNKLIIMGAGNVGLKLCEHMQSGLIESYDEIFFFDNNIKKQGLKINNYYILGKKDVIEKIDSGNVDIIIATDYWRELYSFCKDSGFEEKVVAIYNNTILDAERYISKGFGQECEDLYFKENNIFKSIRKGFYVDVGAHHPIRFSNTWLAYTKGWNGINIEPNDDIIPLFNKLRTRDITVNCGIAEKEGLLSYYKFAEAAYNTFDPSEFEGKQDPKEIVKVPVYRLDSVLEKYDVKNIDFLNIDVEGLELGVLRSNNWDKWRPTYIFVEQKDVDVEEILDSEIFKFLKKFGYKCEYLGIRTAIYKLC